MQAPGVKASLFEYVEQAETVDLPAVQTPEATGFNKRSFVNARLYVSAGIASNRTLDVKLQISEDAETWNDLANGAFNQVIAGTTLPFQQFLMQLPIAGSYIRGVATIGGTDPTWDFKVEYKFLE